MDTGATFIPHVEAAKLMEPGQRPFDDPARPPEATAHARSGALPVASSLPAKIAETLYSSEISVQGGEVSGS